MATNPKAPLGTRERLLKVATKLFAAKGFSQTTVRDIARAGKCNLGLVSYYFDGKDKLYRAIFEDFIQRTMERIEKARLRAGLDKSHFSREDFIRSVRDKMSMMLDEFDTEPELKKMMMREIIDGLTVARKVFEGQTRGLIEKVSDDFERAKKQGYIKASVNAKLFCMLLNRAIEGYVMAYEVSPVLVDSGLHPLREREKFLDQIEEIFLRGILK